MLKNELIELKEKYNLIAVKLDLESESVTLDTAKLLKKISSGIGLDLVIKIGGCGCIPDIITCKNIGANVIVAPMIETEYALEKFIDTANNVYSDSNLPKLSINIETITGAKNFDNIIKNNINNLSSIVFGRSDFTKSLNANDPDCKIVLNYINEIKTKTEKLNKDFIVGGNMTFNSIHLLNDLKIKYIETRNLIFKSDINQDAIKKYLEYEILWLEQKTNKCLLDSKRIELLKSRMN